MIVVGSHPLNQIVSSLGGKNIALRGNGTEAQLRKPPPSLVAVPGRGFGPGVPYLLCRGGGEGSTPTCVAHNDPHVALIILTTCVCGGGGANFLVEEAFGSKICVPAPYTATSVLRKNKGPGTKVHFWIPPSFSG